MSNWCTIESDPGVFTELIEKIGVKGVQVEELYSIGDDDFDAIRPIYGLIFLFKWQQESDPRPVSFDADPKLFFAQQVINNACATQALLAILLNCEEIDIGEELSNFKSFTEFLPADMRGEAIGSMDKIRVSHNSFARPEPFVQEKSSDADKDSDVFHFIAYVPFNGKVYELDGLKQGPIILDDIKDGDWLKTVRPHIEQRIQKYSTTEIRFNLMGLIKNRTLLAEENKSISEERIKKIQDKLANSPSGTETVDSPIPVTDQTKFEEMLDKCGAEGLEKQLAFEKSNIATSEREVHHNKIKFDNWKNENIRRKHNYVPFVVALLKQLAKKKKLEEMRKQGTESFHQRRAAKKGAQSS